MHCNSHKDARVIGRDDGIAASKDCWVSWSDVALSVLRSLQIRPIQYTIYIIMM